MGRETIIAGNWKMYKTIDEAMEFVQALVPKVSGLEASVYLAVPFTAIRSAVGVSGDHIVIGAQNMHDVSEGAFTGEIAGRMLKEAGAHFVLLGHSERRQIFGEDSSLICKKLRRALEDGLRPVLCVGETFEQREAGQTEAVLQEQIKASLAGFEAHQLERLVLAYEPVWAIGTGRTATPEIAEEAHKICRSCVNELFGAELAEVLPILYGGSVKPANAQELMAQPDIDGVLVGGASLEVDSFAQIASAAPVTMS